ncbi:hypothetical protein RF11_02593 [Thelohanellus kitauei]|uniref:Uncharacterized protein n=1 Tax=Thelohanellus kitauei TaxID=669202 RepID=A0A0C2MB75_THEKT|nr:hypothetical protein RF11_02593 [Thelohanellus kitauei]
MAEIRFNKLLLDDATLQDFHMMHGIRIATILAPALDRHLEKKITQSNLIKLQDEEENISTLPTLRCRSCNIYLSPRTKGDSNYLSLGDERQTKKSITHLNTMEKITIDWHKHCTFFQPVVVQIDESLLRAKRQANRRRILAGNENVSIENRIEWRNIYRDIEEEQSLNRNNGMRIEGPWVFGMIECTLQNDGSYKSGETRLFIGAYRGEQYDLE